MGDDSDERSGFKTIQKSQVTANWPSLLKRQCHLLKFIVVLQVVGAMAFSHIWSKWIFLMYLPWVKTDVQAVAVGLLTW